MRDLRDIGKDEPVYADAELVVLIMPDESKQFGSLVFLEGAPAPMRTSLSPEDVYDRLAGTPSKPKLVS
jgi:hypothetical protein